MSKQALVTYFFQSAFTVSLRKTLLVFSYRQEGIQELAESDRLQERDFHSFNNILVFSPSASAAHLDTSIFQWKPSFPTTYILPPEAAKLAPPGANCRICKENDKFTVGYCDIAVYGSTDKGVSYLVTAENMSVFHAGDLNLWHWREENSLRDIDKAEKLFYEKAAQIPRDTIDIAFFPLDPNQGGFYDAGANHFIMSARPKVLFPMHFGKRAEIAGEYARRGISKRTTVFALTKPRESALVDLSGPTSIVRAGVQQATRGQQVSQVDLAAYIHEDPFAQTDLPVDLQKESNN